MKFYWLFGKFHLAKIVFLFTSLEKLSTLAVSDPQKVEPTI